MLLLTDYAVAVNRGRFKGRNEGRYKAKHKGRYKLGLRRRYDGRYQGTHQTRASRPDDSVMDVVSKGELLHRHPGRLRQLTQGQEELCAMRDVQRLF